jgi:DNA-binding Lrp family transcriptional regulator
MEKNIDIALLGLLERDSSLSEKELAIALSIPEKEVKTELTKLKEQGYIVGYQAIINWDKFDDEKANALIEVKATPQNGVGFEKIAHEIAKFEEVSAIYLMSGGFDFSVFIERKTMKEISAFVFDKLATVPGVTSTATHFILKKYKDHNIDMEPVDPDKRLVNIL